VGRRWAWAAAPRLGASTNFLPWRLSDWRNCVLDGLLAAGAGPAGGIRYHGDIPRLPLFLPAIRRHIAVAFVVYARTVRAVARAYARGGG